MCSIYVECVLYIHIYTPSSLCIVSASSSCLYTSVLEDILSGEHILYRENTIYIEHNLYREDSVRTHSL
jgi:hypothetical protein